MILMEQLHAMVDWIDRQSWLDKISSNMQEVVRGFFDKGGPGLLKVRDFLHGVWLGHPLHPVLTDIPIGAWSAAIVLDTIEASTGNRSIGKGADTAVKVGVVGAVGAAVTGVVDWQHTSSRPRRIGSAHAMLNSISLAFFVASLMSRSSRNRQAGRNLALAGFLTSTAAAYLGGHLVYGLKIGVDRSPDLGLPEDFTRVISVEDLPENQPRRVEVGTIPVLLVKRGSHIYALAETCSHMGGPLAEGELVPGQDGQPDQIVCPWHATHFSLADGRPLTGPSTYIQPCFDVQVREGQIYIRAVKETVD
jgi:nitrite reductase/ring-hydroxylating ferredoxin subunit/uncharacterized membrane protein